ncbi:MAG: hypothetical protein BWY15_02237 [Firmicutes bacterium ADurb.Bin193]|nr:MAG: hypothetical protein BWY15_02237 [Firmicutes bacterium ADurb.Bin193]
MKKGEYINTYCGIKFYVLEPDPESVNERDIAHALSLLCRANGHCRHFYSVAQHSINCSVEAEKRGYTKRVQLACLVHDGSEAYIADITRPFKRILSQYLEIEKKIQSCVFERFGLCDLSEDERKAVSDVDDALLYYEFDAMHNIEMWSAPPFIASAPDFSLRETTKVEAEFLQRLESLCGDL